MARPALVRPKWTPAIEALIKELERHHSKIKFIEQHYAEARLAELLAVSERTVSRWAERGWIGYVVLNDGKREQRRYPASEVEKFLKRRFIPPRPETDSMILT